MVKIPIRPLIIDGDIAIVELTKGYFCGIDASDAELVGGRNWQIHRSAKNSLYAATKLWVKGGKRKTLYLHRLLCGGNQAVDHINGETLDNRRSNLRACTFGENQRNRAKLKVTTDSIHKGVYKRALKVSHRVWFSKIIFNGKCIYLGSFYSEEEAATAYNEASTKYHAEFGRHNSVPA